MWGLFRPKKGCVRHRWRSYPVTEGWYAECCDPYPEFARASRKRLKKEIIRLLKKSDRTISDRLGSLPIESLLKMPIEQRRKFLEGSLSPEDHRRLDVATHHFNVRTSIDFLVGRPLSDFGFTGADQVHGNSINFHNEGQCGCILHIVFDHNRRFENWTGKNERQHHPHYPKFVCEKHRHLASDIEALHWVVHAHNRL